MSCGLFSLSVLLVWVFERVSLSLYISIKSQVPTNSSIGIFQATYEETLLRDYSPSSISWIFAVQVALMWAPGPLFGRVIDTYGPAPVLYPGCLLAVLGLCMTSLAQEYYQIFLAQGLCFGLGAGAIFTSAMVCVGQWFVRRRGLAAGIATSGSSLGGVVFPIFLHKVMSEVGFYTAVRYAALLVGILLAIACLLVRRRLPVKKWDGDAKWMDMRLLKETSFASYTFGCFCVMYVFIFFALLKMALTNLVSQVGTVGSL